MKLVVKILRRYESSFRALRAKYEELDRELFEENPGIKVIKAKRNAKPADDMKTFFNDYEKMSTEEQKRALARLLEIQTNMSQKT